MAKRVKMGFNLRLVLFMVAGTGALLFLKTFEPDMGRGLAVVLFALFWGFLWSAFFFYRDLYEKEPLRLLVRVFCLGGLSVLAVVVGNLALGFGMRQVGLRVPYDEVVAGLDVMFPLPLQPGLFLSVALAAGFEEICKFGAAWWGAGRSDELNELMDGIVYGAIAGIGFATVECILYEILSKDNLLNVSTFRIFTFLDHAVYSGLFFFYWGRCRLDPQAPKARLLLTGFALATTLHAVANYLILIAQRVLQDEATREAFAPWAIVSIVCARWVFLPVMWFILGRWIDFSLDRSPFKKNPALKKGEWIWRCNGCRQFLYHLATTCPQCGSDSLHLQKICPSCGAKNRFTDPECCVCHRPSSPIHGAEGSPSPLSPGKDPIWPSA